MEYAYSPNSFSVNLHFSVVSMLDDRIHFEMLISVTRAQHELDNTKHCVYTFDADIQSDQKHHLERMERDSLSQLAFHYQLMVQ
jgi:hypothetical protein